MPENTSSPIVGAPDWMGPQASPWLPVNRAHRRLEALGRCGIVQSRASGTPPITCADGDCYLIVAPDSGEWDAHAGEMAVAKGTDAAQGWEFIEVNKAGTALYVVDEAALIRFDGATWTYPISADDMAYQGLYASNVQQALDELYQAIAEVVAGSIPSGIAFPVSPSDGDTFYRRDRGILYFYDLATTQWLSVQIFTAEDQSLNAGITASANLTALPNPWCTLYDVRLLDFTAMSQVSSTATWTFDLYKFDAASFTLLGSVTTSGDTAGAYTRHAIALNQNMTSAFEGFQCNVTENTGTATLLLGYVITYRLVG